MRTLVMGWFSFEGMGVTAGDLLARDLVCGWLSEAGQAWDVASAPAAGPGVDWRTVDPARYSRLVFVCGPFAGSVTEPFLTRFAHCRRVGVNLSMLRPLSEWNPFDALWERDSSATARPDVTYLSSAPRVPVVGVILVHPQSEYGARGMHARADALIRGLTSSREMAVVPIDTCLEGNAQGLRTPAEVESLIARMDVVVTTRMHGMVLALKNGVPAVAVDPVAGGAKVRRQAEAVGWPAAPDVERLTPGELEAAFDYCLTEPARARAEECRARAVAELERVREEVVAELRSDAGPGPRVGRDVPGPVGRLRRSVRHALRRVRGS